MPLTISLTAGEEIDLASNGVAYTKQSLVLIHILLLTQIVRRHCHIVMSATVLVEHCYYSSVRRLGKQLEVVGLRSGPDG